MGDVEVQALLLDGALIFGDTRRLERCMRAGFEATLDARLSHVGVSETHKRPGSLGLRVGARPRL